MITVAALDAGKPRSSPVVAQHVTPADDRRFGRKNDKFLLIPQFVCIVIVSEKLLFCYKIMKTVYTYNMTIIIVPIVTCNNMRCNVKLKLCAFVS